MLNSRFAILFLISFLSIELLAVVDSSTVLPHANKNISKVQKIRFSATVDTVVFVSLKNEAEFIPRFTYSMSNLFNLTDSSTILVGFDSHWLIQCRNAKVIQNESFFTLPESIRLIVHNPAKLGISSYPANIDMNLIVNISKDSLIELDLCPYFESDKK
jgi:hypothetical protein